VDVGSWGWKHVKTNEMRQHHDIAFSLSASI